MIKLLTRYRNRLEYSQRPRRFRTDSRNLPSVLRDQSLHFEAQLLSKLASVETFGLRTSLIQNWTVLLLLLLFVFGVLLVCPVERRTRPELPHIVDFLPECYYCFNFWPFHYLHMKISINDSIQCWWNYWCFISFNTHYITYFSTSSVGEERKTFFVPI